MPIRAYLDRDHRFDGETLRLMGIAFEMALASHPAAAPGGGDPVREALAQEIIAVTSARSRASLRGRHEGGQPSRPTTEIAAAGRVPRKRPTGRRLTGQMG